MIRKNQEHQKEGDDLDPIQLVSVLQITKPLGSRPYNNDFDHSAEVSEISLKEKEEHYGAFD